MKSGAVLGLDIGSSRVRIAVVDRVRGKMHLRNVISRDLPADAATHGEVVRIELVAASIEEILDELGTRERRCICGIGAPGASLRSMMLPPMTSIERMQAARIEMERDLGRGIDDVVVRVHPGSAGTGTYRVGAVSRRVLNSRVATARKAGLNVVAVDHEALALRRCFDGVDAIVDVGLERTACYSFGEKDCVMSWAKTGGSAITQTIRRDLHLEYHTAEQRKRIVGIAGAGEPAVVRLVGEIATLVEATQRGRARIGSLCVVGNGSRIPSFEERLSQRLGLPVHRTSPQVELDERLPPEVARRAKPDWALAIGLALWEPS